MEWSVKFLDDDVKAELDEQPGDVRANFLKIVALIVELGLQGLPAKYLAHVEGKIWEMRMRGKDGIARALHVTATGKRVVILRVFTKKTQKTPRREIDLALERAKEME